MIQYDKGISRNPIRNICSVGFGVCNYTPTHRLSRRGDTKWPLGNGSLVRGGLRTPSKESPPHLCGAHDIKKQKPMPLILPYLACFPHDAREGEGPRISKHTELGGKNDTVVGMLEETRSKQFMITFLSLFFFFFLQTLVSSWVSPASLVTQVGGQTGFDRQPVRGPDRHDNRKGRK